MHVILVDGTCVFCNGLVRFIMRRDRRALFRFGHIQGTFGRAALARHGADPTDVDGVYVLVDAGTPAERLCVDGRAAREIWPRLSRLGFFVRLIPLFLLDLYYKGFARVRYRLFGQLDACSVPTADERARFME